jgi:cytochrome c oxidase assembly protein subunit 15
MFKTLSIVAVAWTFCLVVLGVYVRLSDAGLGCPDWPGCYGHPTPIQAHVEISAELAKNPTGPVSVEKAWKEIVHRMFAGGLVVLVAVLAVLAIKQRDQLRRSPVLSIAIVLLICVQAAFGAWTVTMKLRPVIVTTHLLLGLSTLGLLMWSAMRQRDWAPIRREAGSLRFPAAVGLVVLIAQIVLGGWTSTNYAATACEDFPTCQGQLMPKMEFHNSFTVDRELGYAPDGSKLTMENLRAIHWTHRVGALVTFCYLAWLVARLYRRGVLRSLAVAIGLALLLQIGLGVGNVLLHLPLPVAVMHNAGAALLLCLVIALNYRLARRR